MSKNLVIVESPTKAKTLKKYLGADYVVLASMGHVRDLPKSKLGVDIEDNFEPVYEVMEGKSKTISQLKKEATSAQVIYLAMDPDREGEAIAYHMNFLLSEKAKKSSKKVDPSTAKKSTASLRAQDDEAGMNSKPASSSKFKRVTFHEITKPAILEAMEHPGEVNMALVDAQQARRVVDRLVGYNLSPLLWRKVRRGLSAGRVQSVALRLIVEREGEIEAFKAQEYWTIATQLSKKQDPNNKLQTFLVELVEIEGHKVVVKGSKEDPSTTLRTGPSTDSGQVKGKRVVYIDSKEAAESVVMDLENASYRVSGIERKERKQNPYPPFTTSTLQQAASNVLGWSGKQTMRIAQQLYEAGLITYHRTDSTNLAAPAVDAVRAFIFQEYGERYVSAKPIFYATKSKSAQEAHEAIRPTQVEVRTPEGVSGTVTDRHEKLYRLIWNRFVACQMASVILDQTTVTVVAEGMKKYSLRTTGSVVKFEGWKVLNSKFKIQNPKSESISEDAKPEDNELPVLTEGEALTLIEVMSEKKATLPPPRYNDASLVKELEKRGIGRPSTYASIISVLEDRAYVERQEKRFIPTVIGTTVVEFLVKNFDTVMDYDFTAKMEDDLDEIANGNKQWRKVMAQFWKPFDQKLEKAKDADRVKVPVEQTGRKCPGEDNGGCKLEGDLVIRSGRFGKFISCDKYPECKYTERLVEKLEGFVCPECGGEVVMKRTRKGRSFWGCANYPKCEYASWKDPREKAKK